MKEIIINSKKYGQKNVLVDDEDFEWLNSFKWCLIKSIHTFYAARTDYSNGIKFVQMHRLILGLTDPKILVDHADKNGLNNCRDNIRISTHSQNNTNRIHRKDSQSKYIGITWFKRNKKWAAQISYDYKKIHLGIYKTEEEAAMAYNNKAVELYGEFANLNTL